MKKLLLLFVCIAAVLLVLPVEAIQLPNYAAGGNVQSEVQTKGKAFTDLISMVVAILAIIGILIGAGYFGVGNGEKGKKFVVGGIIALILAGSVYGIAKLAIG